MIYIDASTLEGGGQLPRLALCLCALTLTPIHLTNIRANRASPWYSKKPSRPPKPGKDGGLKESHLAALTFLAEACDAKVTGDEVGSREVTFRPRKNCVFKETSVRIELKNPGSVFLIFQALYPYLLFARYDTAAVRGGEDRVGSSKFELMLKGGTNVDKSMSLEYVQQVFLPICQKIGLPGARVECAKRGWAGSAQEVGEVRITLDRAEVKDRDGGFVLDWFRIEERGRVEKVVINVLAHPEGLRKMIVEKAKERLRSALGEEVEIAVEVNEDSEHESRMYVLLVAHASNGWRLGRDFLGSGRKARNDKEREMAVDRAARKAVGELVEEIEAGSCVDEHMQDQLVVFQALAKGASAVKGGNGEGTLHTQTARWVCEQVLGEKGASFDQEGGSTGVGWNGVDKRDEAVLREMQRLKIEDGEEHEDEGDSDE